MKRWWAQSVRRIPELAFVPKHARRGVRRRAVAKIPKPIRIGFLLILSTPACALQIVFSTGPNSMGLKIVAAVAVLAPLLPVWILFWSHMSRCIAEDLARRPCWHCGYSLIGLSRPRCPECGEVFDPLEYEEIEAKLTAMAPTLSLLKGGRSTVDE